MAPRVTLTPVGHLSAAEVEWPGDEACVFLDHVDIASCPSDWPPGDVIVFRASKNVREHLMTPDAHFYGNRAHGMLIRHDKLGGEAALYRAVDGEAFDRRKLTLALCRADGGTLPEPSDQLYPTSSRVCVPVTYDTFSRFAAARWVTLSPVPHRGGEAPETWVYGDCAEREADPERAVRLCAEVALRNYARPDGTTVRYAIRGCVLKHKIIRPPLSRNAGFHTQPGALPRDRALPGVLKRAISVRTQKYVLPLHDFRIGGQAVRVLRLTATGFDGYRLFDEPSHGSLKRVAAKNC